MTTLVLCVDRSNSIGRLSGQDMPVLGESAVRSLIMEVGVADPEDTSVNSLFEGLRIAQEIRDEGDPAEVAVISGADDSTVRADRAVARQLEALVAEVDATSAIVIIDNAEEEQVIPIIESRIPVDAVDRVVIRQARDLESTYYQLKQFLADEELRQTTLVPIGVALVALPVLLTQTGPGIALATITAVFGLFLLYKGLGLDRYVAGIPGWIRRSLYSGRVSIVTYAVAAGLALIGAFAGVLGVSRLGVGQEAALLLTMQFLFDSIPWLAVAALVGSLGRMVDEAIQNGHLPAPYLNIPFGVVALGIVTRGFAAYFLQTAGATGPLMLPRISLGPVSISSVALTPGQRLATFVLAGILVSLVGVRVSTYFGDLETSEIDIAD